MLSYCHIYDFNDTNLFKKQRNFRDISNSNMKISKSKRNK